MYYKPMTIDELRTSDEYYIHHTELTTGDVTKWEKDLVLPYIGRYGRGYKVIEPTFISYFINYRWTTYYIKIK